MIKFLIFKGQQGGLVDRCLLSKPGYLSWPKFSAQKPTCAHKHKNAKKVFFLLESLIKLIVPQARLVKQESINS